MELSEVLIYYYTMPFLQLVFYTLFQSYDFPVKKYKSVNHGQNEFASFCVEFSSGKNQVLKIMKKPKFEVVIKCLFCFVYFVHHQVYLLWPERVNILKQSIK